MKKVLLTGANGYIGAYLSKRFSEDKALVTGIFYPEVPSDAAFLRYFNNYYCGDISNDAFINEITNNEYDLLIHLVSLDHHQSNNKPKIISNINILPLWNLLEEFSIKDNLKKSLYFSTVHVYGNPQLDITEITPPLPKNKYALTHYLTEDINNFYNTNSKIQGINIRLSNSYGPPIFSDANCWWLVVNDLCRTLYNTGEIRLQSDGMAQRDFINREDVYQAIKLIDIDNKDINLFNISSGVSYYIIELAIIVKKCYKQMFGKDCCIYTPQGKLNNIDELSFSQKKQLVKNENLQKLGFKPIFSIEDGIYELFRYLNA